LRRSPWLLTLGVLLSLVGAVAPWIPHRAAGLNVGGFFLFEVTKFLPAVRAGAVTLFREGFLLPLLASGVLLAALPAFAPQPSRCARLLCPPLGAGIALAALPPYPAILSAHRDPEYRGQLIAAATALLLIGASFSLRHLPSPARRGLAAALTLGAAAPALLMLLRVRPLFAQLYAVPVGTGWGAWTYAVGCVLTLVALAIQSERAAPSQPPPDQSAAR